MRKTKSIIRRALAFLPVGVMLTLLLGSWIIPSPSPHWFLEEPLAAATIPPDCNVTLVPPGGLGSRPAFAQHNGEMTVLNADGSMTITDCSDVAAALRAGWQQQPTYVSSAVSGSIGGPIAPAACVSAAVTVTNLTNLKALVVQPQTYPGNGISWRGSIPSAGVANVHVCNYAAGTVTATPSLYNVRALP